MGHRQRMYLPGEVYEETIRTEHGTFWLRPDAGCRTRVEGVLGKGLQHYEGVALHAYDVQSNHLHLLLSASDPSQIPLFLDFVNGNIARQVNRLRERTGHFWGRRCAVIPVVDDRAQIARLRYVVAQGTAAGLVASPKDWPGASSTAALLGDQRVVARYTSLDRLRRNARLASPRPVAELAEDVSFELAPLPVWAHLSPSELRGRHAALVAEIEAQHHEAPVLGAAAVRRQSPDRQPRTFVRTPMPRCHASSRAARRRFDSVYRAFRDAYLAAAARLRADPKAQRAATTIDRLYPPGALARPGWYVAPPSNFQAPWRRGTDDVDKFEVRR